MSIRINKVLGYGFKYSKHEEDPRFSSRFWELRDRYEKRELDLQQDILDAIHQKDKFLHTLIARDIEFSERYDVSWRDFMVTSPMDDSSIAPIIFTKIDKRKPPCFSWGRNFVIERVFY